MFKNNDDKYFEENFRYCKKICGEGWRVGFESFRKSLKI